LPGVQNVISKKETNTILELVPLMKSEDVADEEVDIMEAALKQTQSNQNWLCLGCAFFMTMVVISMIGLVLILTFYNTKQAPANYSMPSFGSMAAEINVPMWNQMMKFLPLLNDSATPTFAQSGRKTVIAVRNVLDIYEPSYPIPRVVGEDDLWIQMRNDLNGVYTAIGDFQDLDNVNYTKEKYTTRQETMLQMRDRFMNNSVARSYFQYISHPNPHNFTIRFNADLSKLFWRDTKYMSDAKLPGPLNLGRLSLTMIDRLQVTFTQMMKITNISDSDAGSLVHFYKKELRACLTLFAWYPSLFIDHNDTIVLTFMNLAPKCYKELSDTHELIMVFEYYNSNGGTAVEIEKSQQKLIVGWAAAKTWFNTSGWIDSINKLQQTIVVDVPQLSGKSFAPVVNASLSFH